MALKKVVYLSSEDYNTLITDGSVTVNGETITYSADDIYLTPDNTAEQLEAYDTALRKEGAIEVFSPDYPDYPARLYTDGISTGGIEHTSIGGGTKRLMWADLGEPSEANLYLNSYKTGAVLCVDDNSKIFGIGETDLTIPFSKSGTLATEEWVTEQLSGGSTDTETESTYYQHHIYWRDTTNNIHLNFTLNSKDSTQYSLSNIVDLFMWDTAIGYYDAVDFPVSGVAQTKDGTGMEAVVCFGLEGSGSAYNVLRVSDTSTPNAGDLSLAGVMVVDRVSPLNMTISS